MAAASSSSSALPAGTGAILSEETERVDFPLLSASSYVGISQLPAIIQPHEPCEWLLYGSGPISRTSKYDQQFGFLSLDAALFQRESCRVYNKVILTGESGAHNFFICSRSTHTQLWTAACSAWHGMAKPGKAGGPAAAPRQPLAYAVGGQFREASRRARMKQKWYDGIWLYALREQLSEMYAERLALLVDGHHPGCVELRKKCLGAGEFDGQSSFTWVPFLQKFLLLTRASRAEIPPGGHRGGQAACGMLCGGH